MLWRLKSTAIRLFVRHLVLQPTSKSIIKGPHHLSFVRGIHRWRMDSPQKGQVMWKAFSMSESHHMKLVINSYLCQRPPLSTESTSLPLKKPSQIAKFMGPTWGPTGCCRPQMGPMLAPWTLLSGMTKYAKKDPQESVLGPLSSNLLIEDSFFELYDVWPLHRFTDDSTIWWCLRC